MDPVSLVIAALGAGAAAAAEDTASEAVKDAYHGLRGLLRRLFTRQPELAAAEEIVDQYEQQPDTGEAPLKDALAQAGADQDADLVAAAQRLLQLVDPEGAAAGKFTVTVAGNVQGQVVGDHAAVTMNFGDPPKGS